MQFQVEMLVQVLEVARAKAGAVIQAAPESRPQLESHAFLLALDVQKVLRQAIALQELALAPSAPLMEPPVLSKSVLRRLQVQGLVEEEAQVEALPPQELVEVPLQGLE